MKKIFKALLFVIMWGGVIPSGAGYGIMVLWNNLLPGIIGCGSITWLQGMGLFLLGQLLSCGFIIGLFLLGGAIHAAAHSGRHGHDHWHRMSDEEKRDFWERRRQWFEMSHRTKRVNENEQV